MIIANRSLPQTSYEIVYGQGGMAQAYVTTPSGLASGGLFKVWYGPAGFVIGPTEAQANEYFVAYVPRTLPAGSQVMAQIGGLIPLMRLAPGLKVGMWVSLRPGDQIGSHASPFPRSNDFGCVNEVDDEDRVRVWLLPRPVREMG